MAFTNPEFPEQIFDTISEYQEARVRRRQVEESIAERASEETTQVTARVIPASRGLLERKVLELESKLHQVSTTLQHALSEGGSAQKSNQDGLEIGLVLRGESRGLSYTLEVTDQGYLCSDGVIYKSLSHAALGVSGNRRSGWKFWRDIEGTSVGETTGRFNRSVAPNRTRDT